MAKRRGGKVELTIEEIVATLRRSQLPTVVIEGKDDAIIFRRLEASCQDIQLSAFPVGGRTRALALFDNRQVFGLPRTVSFAVDKDMWVIDGVPTEYETAEIVLTDGYSIENDVYRDGDLEVLLLPGEQSVFKRELEEFLNWYAGALSNRDHEALRTHPNEVLERRGTGSPGVEEHVQTLLDYLRTNYSSSVRGKSLVGLLMRQVSRPGRGAQHSKASLLEQVAAKPGPYITRLFSAVKSFHSPSAA
jgi:hypothetical protein